MKRPQIVRVLGLHVPVGGPAFYKPRSMACAACEIRPLVRMHVDQWKHQQPCYSFGVETVRRQELETELAGANPEDAG